MPRHAAATVAVALLAGCASAPPAVPSEAPPSLRYERDGEVAWLAWLERAQAEAPHQRAIVVFAYKPTPSTERPHPRATTALILLAPTGGQILTWDPDVMDAEHARLELSAEQTKAGLELDLDAIPRRFRHPLSPADRARRPGWERPDSYALIVDRRHPGYMLLAMQGDLAEPGIGREAFAAWLRQLPPFASR